MTRDGEISCRNKNSGFGLIEIMVAMVIGMFGIIVMMQVLTTFEGQKRSTTGGSDAQNVGAIALYNVQRDIQQSGYGLSSLTSLGCGLTLPNGVVLSSLAPVTINPAVITGQDANTDTLLVVYSNTDSPIEGNGVTSQPSQNTYAVQTASSFKVGDYIYALPKNRPAPCNLTVEQVNAVNLPYEVVVPTGMAGAVKGSLFNLGKTLKILAYAVRNKNLTLCDYTANNCGDATKNTNSTVWVPIANNIVSLKAQYGRQDPASGVINGIIDTYDITTPSIASATLSCDWLRISALRIALVARSTQFEKGIVTNATKNITFPNNAPKWSGWATNPILGAGTLGPDTQIDENWKHYRYKVFETTVPLRNVTWMLSQGVKAGC